jgi:hypothetical protein
MTLRSSQLEKTMDAETLFLSLIETYRGDVAAAREPRERLVLAVGRLATELELGGASGFLYNVSPDAAQPQTHWAELRDVVTALRSIGAHVSADALEAILPLLETDKPDEGTWSSFIDCRGIDIDALDNALEEPDALWSHLDRYLEGSARGAAQV